MQWIFALFYKLFGSRIIISRLLSFFIGLLSVYGMYYWCRNIFNNKVIATICAWCFNFSPVFYYYTINPMPDNMALCCGIWSLGFFCRFLNSSRYVYTLYSAFFFGLATLVKLPFILYGMFIFAFVIAQLRRKEYSIKQLSLICIAYAVFIAPAAAWYVTVIPGWGNNPIVRGILDTQLTTAETFGILSRMLYANLPELLINYGSTLFFLAGFYFLFRSKVQRHKYFPMYLLTGICLILYFLFEMNAITLVHDYYLFPFLPFIFLLVAYGAHWLLQTNSRSLKALSVICLMILPLTAFLRADTRWDKRYPEFNIAYFDYRDELRQLTPPGAYCIVGNDESRYICLYYIDRKGWAFDHDRLDAQRLSYYMSKGAAYLFTDSPVDEKPGVKEHLEKIFDKENLRVYKLK
jgi:4-amino-4-deoxy-L-arabinose transferase-like glycosyltransferase